MRHLNTARSADFAQH